MSGRRSESLLRYPADRLNVLRGASGLPLFLLPAVTGVPLAGSYLQLVEDQPGGLGVIGLPHLDAGPFLSYGIQWIAFGILAPIGLGYFVISEIRQRRREKAASAPLSPEEKLADRYGRRR